MSVSSSCLVRGASLLILGGRAVQRSRLQNNLILLAQLSARRSAVGKGFPPPPSILHLHSPRHPAPPAGRLLFEAGAASGLPPLRAFSSIWHLISGGPPPDDLRIGFDTE